MIKWETSYGYVYFVDESLCKIRWLLENLDFAGGVEKVAFSPHEPSQIYGVASSSGELSYVFKIDNMFPASTNSVRFQAITAGMYDSLVGFHIPPEEESGALYLIYTGSVVHTSPMDSFPKEWVLSNSIA